MTGIVRILRTWRVADGVADEALSVSIGFAFTLGLLVAMAHFGNGTTESPSAEFEELRAVSIPLEAPPPPVVQRIERSEAPAPLAGIELGASDSPVKIAVVPPDLDSLMPPTDVAPAAMIQTAQLYTSFKPRTEVGEDFQRVFQKSEVDRIPTVSFRPTPVIPSDARKGADQLRVVVLLVVDTHGSVANVRVFKTSGNPKFDSIIAASIQQDWVFTPAYKKGKKVKCLLEQAVTVRWKSGSPFSI